MDEIIEDTLNNPMQSKVYSIYKRDAKCILEDIDRDIVTATQIMDNQKIQQYRKEFEKLDEKKIYCLIQAINFLYTNNISIWSHDNGMNKNMENINVKTIVFIRLKSNEYYILFINWKSLFIKFLLNIGTCQYLISVSLPLTIYASTLLYPKSFIL